MIRTRKEPFRSRDFFLWPLLDWVKAHGVQGSRSSRDLDTLQHLHFGLVCRKGTSIGKSSSFVTLPCSRLCSSSDMLSLTFSSGEGSHTCLLLTSCFCMFGKFPSFSVASFCNGSIRKLSVENTFSAFLGLCVSIVSSDLRSSSSVQVLGGKLGLCLRAISSFVFGESRRSSSALSFLNVRCVFGVDSCELLLPPLLGLSLPGGHENSSSGLFLFPFSGVLAPLNEGLGNIYLGPSPRIAGAKCNAPMPPSPHPSPGLFPLPMMMLRKSESYPQDQGSSPPAAASAATQE